MTVRRSLGVTVLVVMGLAGGASLRAPLVAQGPPAPAAALSGTVGSREEKRAAEACAESVSGVREVINQLRVKQRGGKTWNFTDRGANADALFVFHRDVESARKKLAAGYAAAQ